MRSGFHEQHPGHHQHHTKAHHPGKTLPKNDPPNHCCQSNARVDASIINSGGHQIQRGRVA
ncbi:Uncharacterised protein [Corynebacterium cystitidis]|uniref:Uncharacterized protein n=1 Tax=Corynebacterium cystitidis DSM 20524 TaxID=1121357 RepID=A0A1H9RE34_9CORY|nr:hypothetical protein SAMN05661109_00859 [Corynebacterium cystitidis DSM 20524]SNV87195.1 Uncharacterised protein [Corynebacterium cystitidis]